MALDHYHLILRPHLTPISSAQLLFLKNLIAYKCPADFACKLSSPFSSEDIRCSLLNMPNKKTPGIYGFTSQFYKFNWGLLGDEVISSIKHFFFSSFMPKAVNATVLTLIPKKQGAAVLKDFRPLSCCSTLYKLTTRLIADRLKIILPDFILPNQTAFVKDRLIMENVLLASELMNGYGKQGGPKRLTLKVDLAKAFDYIKWDFLLAVLE